MTFLVNGNLVICQRIYNGIYRTICGSIRQQDVCVGRMSTNEILGEPEFSDSILPQYEACVATGTKESYPVGMLLVRA